MQPQVSEIRMWTSLRAITLPAHALVEIGIRHQHPRCVQASAGWLSCCSSVNLMPLHFEVGVQVKKVTSGHHMLMIAVE